MTDLIIHIGLPKCGSTSIQRFYAGYRGYLGRGALDERANNFCTDLLRASHANRLGGLNKRRLHRWCDRVQERIGDHPLGAAPLVISSEVFSKTGKYGYAQMLEFLEALARMWPNGALKVMLTIRAQATKIASEYAQRSARRFNASQIDFERYVERRVKQSDLDYDELISDLESIVDLSGVHVSLLEDMGEQHFWHSMIDFCGLTGELQLDSLPGMTNRKSLGDKCWKIRDPSELMASKDFAGSLLAYTWPYALMPPTRAQVVSALVSGHQLVRPLLGALETRRDKKILISESLERSIKTRFAQSNLALAESMGRDLSALGY